jgi:hypothetical protein
MRVGISIRGDIAALMQDETVETARGLRDGVDRARAALQDELRGQTARALPRGRAIANAWRSKMYPTNPLTVTMHPAAVVWTRAPNVITPLETGEVIRVKRGAYMVWPTAYNASGGRRNAGSRGGVKVTIAEMTAARGQSVVLRSRKSGLSLWCLRIRQASSTGGRTGRGKGRVRLYVGSRNVEILTGRIKASERVEKAQELLTRGLVPMFFMAKQVRPGKRLDIAGAAARADGTLPGFIERALSAR